MTGIYRERLARGLAYQSDPRCLRSAPWSHRLQEDVAWLVQDFMGWQHEQPRCKYQLAIVLQTTHLLSGTCGIHMATAHAREVEAEATIVDATTAVDGHALLQQNMTSGRSAF